MKYLFYNEVDNKGVVSLIYYSKPNTDVINNFDGMVEYDGELSKDGFTSTIFVDLGTKEVTVEYEPIIEEKSNDELSIENQKLREELDLVSDMVDFLYREVSK